MIKKIFIFLFIVFCVKFAFANEYITQNVQGGCVEISYISAVFEPKTYNCSSGYFLPANTDGCIACPQNAICAGGTFTFDMTHAQGIIQDALVSSNISHGCAANLLMGTIPSAVFEPNTITISWDDGDNDPTNNPISTCMYDGAISTPTTIPTKRGHIFNGWRFNAQ